MASMALIIDGPKVDVIRMAVNTAGNPNSRSENRMTASSTNLASKGVQIRLIPAAMITTAESANPTEKFRFPKNRFILFQPYPRIYGSICQIYDEIDDHKL